MKMLVAITGGAWMFARLTSQSSSTQWCCPTGEPLYVGSNVMFDVRDLGEYEEAVRAYDAALERKL
jgi:hypothetical protein